jgi:hypothetical protein
VEAIARQSWGMAQRVGMQIAGLPQEEREPALAKAEISLRNTAVEMGIAGAQMDGWIDIQMRAIRGMVQQIEAGGQPQGGHA